jgi:hypothetical protein
MSLTSTILHPRLFRGLPAFFPSRCTIRLKQAATLNSIGEAEPGWPELAGHIAIPCNIAAKAGNTQEQQSEVRTSDITYVSKDRHCMLDGYYPLISEEMAAEVDGIMYDIRGVVQQSAREHTKLMLELIT